MTSFLDHVFVIHVSEGYEERRHHIDRHLPERGIANFEYMLRGDIKDLTPEVKAKYFIVNDKLPVLSCAYKHVLVYKEMVKRGIERALILEDDAFLANNALAQLQRVDIEMRDEVNFIVNIEHSNRSVPFKVKKQASYVIWHPIQNAVVDMLFIWMSRRKSPLFLSLTKRTYLSMYFKHICAIF